MKRKFRDGDIIFREGDPSDIAYVVENGKVELSKAGDRDPVQLALLGEGEMFGEMGILDGSPRSATATAVGRVALRMVPREAFLDSLESDPKMARNVISKLTERLRRADDMLAQGANREAASRIRRDKERPARPGFFARLVGLGGGRSKESVDVRLATLTGEGGEEHTRYLMAALEKCRWVRVRMLRQVVEPDMALEANRRLAAVFEAGRAWLAGQKADLLIWGDVMPAGNSLRLRFIPAVEDRTDRPGVMGPWSSLQLPAGFPPEYSQLILAACMTALGGDEERSALLDAALPEILETALPVVQELPREMVSRERSSIQVCYGNAVATIAARKGAADLYQVAANTYRSALEGMPRDDNQVEWAMTQKHFGYVLQALSEKTNETETIGAAVNLYRSLLGVLSRADFPFEWACVQARLGQSLYRLDIKSGDPELLKEALASLQAALQVFQRPENPQRWADIMNSIGQTAQVLGREMRNPELIEKAIEACRAALEVRSRESHPIFFAASQNNLGSALFLLGRMTRDSGYFAEAAAAFQAALETYRAEGAEKMAGIAEKNLVHVQEMLPRQPVRTGRPAWFEEED